ncbi:MAG: hypothetical protein H7Z14_07845, partial [Anaerolineae bacterium]|nr:hypothetical protein [Phycisphaerae bacterium]
MRWIITPIAIFIISRVLIFSVTGLTLHFDRTTHNAQAPVDSNLVVQGMTRWDGGWFIRIAQNGYVERADTNFFPLFPLMGRWVSRISGLSIPASMVLCANVCSLAALIVVYRIFTELDGERVATAALALVVAWPFSFFYAAAYPESIMMLSTAGAIWLAMRRRHLSGGAVLGIGILARHLTALGGLTLLAVQIKERGLHPRRLIFHRDFIGLLLPLAMLSFYFVFLQSQFGDWRIWMRARSDWGSSAWWGVYEFFTQASVRKPEIVFYLVLSIIPGLGAALLLTRRRWRMLAPFAIALMLLLWFCGIAGLGRYSSSCWPAFLPLGAWLATRKVLLICAICVLAICQGMMLYLFVHL